MCLYVLNSVLWWQLRLLHKNDVRFVFTSSCLLEGSCLIYVICLCFCIVVFCFLPPVCTLCCQFFLFNTAFQVLVISIADIYDQLFALRFGLVSNFHDRMCSTCFWCNILQVSCLPFHGCRSIFFWLLFPYSKYDNFFSTEQLVICPVNQIKSNVIFCLSNDSVTTKMKWANEHLILVVLLHSEYIHL